MIIYALLELIFFILSIIGSIFGDLIPSFPTGISTYISVMNNYIITGFRFLSIFFDYQLVIDLLEIILAWYTFLFVKDNIMKVIGHFLGN